MLLKLGVDISRLNREIRRALKVIDQLYNIHKEEAVITSTYEGNHSPNSLHYSNDAIDIRILQRGSDKQLLKDLKDACEDNYDIIMEYDHFHIEYNPK